MTDIRLSTVYTETWTGIDAFLGLSKEFLNLLNSHNEQFSQVLTTRSGTIVNKIRVSALKDFLLKEGNQGALTIKEVLEFFEAVDKKNLQFIYGK